MIRFAILFALLCATAPAQEKLRQENEELKYKLRAAEEHIEHMKKQFEHDTKKQEAYFEHRIREMEDRLQAQQKDAQRKIDELYERLSSADRRLMEARNEAMEQRMRCRELEARARDVEERERHQLAGRDREITKLRRTVNELYAQLPKDARARVDRMRETMDQVERLVPALVEMFEGQFDRIPPATHAELARLDPWKGKKGGADNVNECAETLLRALRGTDDARSLFKLGLVKVSDTDGDKLSESCDGYGNPLVYIPLNAYGKRFTVVNREGKRLVVEARKKKDGTYYNPVTYQLISLGPDGRPSADDIPNFLP